MARGLTLLLLAVLLSACTATPCPSPAPVVQPTPQIVTRDVPGPTVYQTPPACTEVVQMLGAAGLEQNVILLSILNAYVDYPNEDLLDFGRRVESIIDKIDLKGFPANYDALLNECLGANTPSGSNS